MSHGRRQEAVGERCLRGKRGQVRGGRGQVRNDGGQVRGDSGQVCGNLGEVRGDGSQVRGNCQKEIVGAQTLTCHPRAGVPGSPAEVR